MVKFLIDESTGQAVVNHLRALGYDVAAVAELMPQAPDEEVIVYAHRERRVLISNDRDFGERVYRDGHPHAGVLLLRLADEHASVKMRVVAAILQEYGQRLPDSFAVASEQNIRFRARR
ncbi:MAG: hypothetical protein DWI57_05460 [Chloroflexi bacterium]|nr:MAG: hypothetical protein DWI57_05460 [Chloroflexota bacterium]